MREFRNRLYSHLKICFKKQFFNPFIYKYDLLVQLHLTTLNTSSGAISIPSGNIVGSKTPVSEFMRHPALNH